MSPPTSAPQSEPLVGVDPARVADLLREAGDLHHRVYRITDGEDPDWATWYATWLVELSELPRAARLRRRPERARPRARRPGARARRRRAVGAALRPPDRAALRTLTERRGGDAEVDVYSPVEAVSVARQVAESVG